MTIKIASHRIHLAIAARHYRVRPNRRTPTAPMPRDGYVTAGVLAALATVVTALAACGGAL